MEELNGMGFLLHQYEVILSTSYGGTELGLGGLSHKLTVSFYLLWRN